VNGFEYLHRRLDGSVFMADVLLTRIDLGSELFLQATVRDITSRKQTETALRENQTRLRELAAQGVASREAELKSIAREVHDELGQVLTALRMDISLLRMQFGEQNPLLLSKIEDMRVLIDQAIQGVRDVTVNLRPPALDMGLVPALNWLCNEFNARNLIPCVLQAVEPKQALSEEQIMVIFRIVQESLTNVVRHAGASRVEITLTQGDDGLTVTIRDDGQGFDPDAPRRKKSFGLMGMMERALAINGSVNVASSPVLGTVITAHIPFDVVRLLRRRSDDTSVNCG
jgi:signal transduction histidine kinase